ncbi:MAG: NAD(P)-binding domain-containing protein [Candidatus Dormibacteraeota bacterium]|nr:NAD(P)-binding domain-containing protein [Candidatus Dormibacteraeota bacterium]
MSALPRVCIIGAGSSGIAAAKALHQRGIPFDCFEKGDRVGGNWVFGNRNGMSSAYRSLHINTSRERMEYSDFPMPRHYPDFPHHSHIAEYFDAYVDHFGFRDRITFGTTVERAELTAGEKWVITLEGGGAREYEALMVANGHHWDARWPEPPFPGRFDGQQMHSHDYIDNSAFRGKNVVVLGMGNSAMDIAVETSQVAEKVFLSARRGAWIIPKYIFGRPLDQLGNDPRVPFAVRQRIYERILRISVGRMENYGLPRPDHRPGEAHPTISSDILVRVGSGDVEPKPNIAELCGDRVRFADGSEEAVDVIVYCTGYRVTFPFFDRDFISAPDNDLPLCRRVFKSGVDNVFFIGLLQPLGAIMPLAEAQSEWVADYLTGRYLLPPRDEMLADIERDRERMFKRYVASKRHTMQVDFEDYLYHLARERRRGEKRAAPEGARARR